MMMCGHRGSRGMWHCLRVGLTRSGSGTSINKNIVLPISWTAQGLPILEVPSKRKKEQIVSRS